jgi:hypothetical protein
MQLKNILSYACDPYLEPECRKVRYPFKFNSIWLEDPEFDNLVSSNWAGLVGSESLSPMESMVKKLKVLKELMFSWEKKKRVK